VRSIVNRDNNRKKAQINNTQSGVKQTETIKYKKMEIKKITPFLWFNNQAQEAAKFYCGIFENSKIITSNPMMAIFELEGQRFQAGNFGPQFKFNESISFFVSCDSQEEVDSFWSKLTADGGEEGRCGWLKDKFGLSWQIVPAVFGKLVSDPDPAKSKRVMTAMLEMNKMDIHKLQQAYEGK
jgi:predicted 3-demethylubiquinone-9 3-methyltransferase (glyoxalase superfamily)